MDLPRSRLLRGLLIFVATFAANTAFWLLVFLGLLSLPLPVSLPSYLALPVLLSIWLGIPVLWLITLTYSLARLSGPDEWVGALWAPAALFGVPLMLATLVAIAERQIAS